MFNQNAQINLRGTALCQVMGLSLQTPVWEGINQPLSAERIQAYRQSDQTLKPEPGRMGDELVTLEQHEQRIAWLMNADPAHWAPLQVEEMTCNENGYLFKLADGHHRLLAASLLDCHVRVDVMFGYLPELEQLLVDTAGHWLSKPNQRVFGQGVFPCEDCGHEYIKARCEPGKVWIDDLNTGMCLGRYGTQLWSIGDEIGLSAIPRSHAIRQTQSEHEHLAAFAQACADTFGLPATAFHAYLRKTVPVDRPLKTC